MFLEVVAEDFEQFVTLFHLFAHCGVFASIENKQLGRFRRHDGPAHIEAVLGLY